MTSDPASEPLGHHVTLQRGTTYKSAQLGQPGPVLLGLASIERNGGFRRDKLRTYGGDSPPKLLLGPGDLYVSLKDVTQAGDLLGAVSRVPEDLEQGRLTQDTVKLQLAPGATDAGYLYWLLRTPEYREYCRAHSMGTTNLSLSRESFLAFPVPRLTPARQALTDALESLERKIHSNRRLAGVLEDTAAALFRARFVDFVGVEEFEDSELGPMPCGWSVGRLGDLVDVVMGQSPPGSSYSEDPAAGMLMVQGMGGFGERFPSSMIYTSAPTKRVCAGTTLMTVRAPVGAVNVTRVETCAGRGVAGVVSKFQAFAEFLVRSLSERWASQESGTIFPAVNRRQIVDLPVVVPPRTAIADYDRTASPLVEKLAALDNETMTLVSIRDALLPKLVSGEIRVPDLTDPAEVIEPMVA
jgi:type I restriction enzyme, S subunit